VNRDLIYSCIFDKKSDRKEEKSEKCFGFFVAPERQAFSAPSITTTAQTEHQKSQATTRKITQVVMFSIKIELHLSLNFVVSEG
jgi:hypothetical protein